MSQRISFHDQINKNIWKSVFLMIIIFAVFIVLGVVIGFIAGPTYFTMIMILAVIISLVYLVTGYYNSDKIALASVNAKPASQTQYRQYHNRSCCIGIGYFRVWYSRSAC